MGHPVEMVRQTSILTFTIPASGTTSNGQDLGGYVIASLLMPSAWTTAGITFEASLDGSTGWVPVHGDDGNAVTIASGSLAASRMYVNKAILEQLAGLRHVRILSTVAQAAARDIVVVLKG